MQARYTSSRLDPIKTSASAAVSQTAKALKAAGHDVIDLGLGEPDFDTPLHIIEAAHSAALAGETRYPPNDGTASLKQAIIDKFERDNQLSFSPAEIIAANGAKQVIFDAFMASLEAGDEVLLCAPYFGQYKDIVRILGGKPKIIACEESAGFRLTPQLLADAITPKTRWLLLNHPSNPAGAVYNAAQLSELGEVLASHPHVLIMADEIYEHILFDQQTFCSFLRACPHLRTRVLTVNGVSKAYAMTGWRIGYGAGPVDLIKAMTLVQSQISSGACSVAQAAAAAALKGSQASVNQFREAFEQRRNRVVAKAASIPGLSLAAPGGAFYAFIGCQYYMGTTTPQGQLINDDVQLVQYLLEHAKVAAVPGSAYDMSPYFRLSTAASEQRLDEAMGRINSALELLQQP